MHERAVILAQPVDATELVLLFHGVGSTAASLAPLGQAIAQVRSRAVVVSVEGPHPSTLGSGREWFSVLGITEENRPGRVAEAMPLFRAAVSHWQAASGIAPGATTLVGFSQGAIMSLASTQVDAPAQASRVIALAGRFPQPVRRAGPGTRIHLVHGEQDTVMPARFSIEAAQALASLGGTATLDLLPGLGHSIDGRVVERVLGYLAPPA